jgi:hypothetical protein
MASRGINRNINTLTITASATIGIDVDQVMADATSGAVTATLSAITDGADHELVVRKTDSSANAVTVTDGSLSVTLTTQNQAVTLAMTAAGAWFVTANGNTTGSGDVVGPTSATDNAIARFDGTSGKTIQNSAVTIADTTGVIAGTQGVTFSGSTSGTTALVPTAIAGTTTLTLPAVTDTLVGKATTDTLTNKTLTSPVLTAPAIGAATGTSLAVTGLLKSSSPTAGVGYATGAGGAVTQVTSRTTGVTLDTITGAITLFSAAGSATPASFTVTNAAVAATDVVIVNQKSGTDLYEIFVTAVAAGSFRITFFTTGGTTTEQPVFSFAVIKGVLA